MSNYFNFYVVCAQRLGIIGTKEQGLDAFALADIIHKMDDAWYQMSLSEKERFGEILNTFSLESRMLPILSIHTRESIKHFAK